MTNSLRIDEPAALQSPLRSTGRASLPLCAIDVLLRFLVDLHVSRPRGCISAELLGCETCYFIVIRRRNGTQKMRSANRPHRAIRAANDRSGARRTEQQRQLPERGAEPAASARRCIRRVRVNQGSERGTSTRTRTRAVLKCLLLPALDEHIVLPRVDNEEMLPRHALLDQRLTGNADSKLATTLEQSNPLRTAQMTQQQITVASANETALLVGVCGPFTASSRASANSMCHRWWAGHRLVHALRRRQRRRCPLASVPVDRRHMRRRRFWGRRHGIQRKLAQSAPPCTCVRSTARLL